MYNFAFKEKKNKCRHHLFINIRLKVLTKVYVDVIQLLPMLKKIVNHGQSRGPKMMLPGDKVAAPVCHPTKTLTMLYN